tara:strand:+ start:920 stop:1168 length:249 start_codon:yes stop_codon:yes gene_type:complete
MKNPRLHRREQPGDGGGKDNPYEIGAIENALTSTLSLASSENQPLMKLKKRSHLLFSLTGALISPPGAATHLKVAAPLMGGR